MNGIPPQKIIRSAGGGPVIIVDGFRHASKAPKGTLFFLTHAHSGTPRCLPAAPAAPRPLTPSFFPQTTTTASSLTGVPWAPSTAVSSQRG